MTIHVTVSATIVQTGIDHPPFTLVESAASQAVPETDDVETNALTAAAVLDRYLDEARTDVAAQCRSMIGKATEADRTHARRRAAKPHRG